MPRIVGYPRFLRDRDSKTKMGGQAAMSFGPRSEVLFFPFRGEGFVDSKGRSVKIRRQGTKKGQVRKTARRAYMKRRY